MKQPGHEKFHIALRGSKKKQNDKQLHQKGEWGKHILVESRSENTRIIK